MNNDQFRQIYERYYNDVYLFAFSLCRNHHLAQEITSGTFFKALMSLPDDAPSMKYWLLRVCKNCVVDRWRRSRRWEGGSLDESRAAGSEQDPWERLLQKEEHRRLYKAVLSLREEYREVVQLYYFSGLSGEETARALGKSPGAVRTLLYRARNQLKAQLQEE